MTTLLHLSQTIVDIQEGLSREQRFSQDACRNLLNATKLVREALDALERSHELTPQDLSLPRRPTGHTLLHLACFARMPVLAQWLVLRGCHVNQIDVNGFTPLHFAALNGDACIVELLLEGMPTFCSLCLSMFYKLW
jgi:ankyrin repeat protein